MQSPNITSDLQLNERRAFELCFVVANAQRIAGANPAEETMSVAVREAQQLADVELRGADDGRPLEIFLPAAIEKICEKAEETARRFQISETARTAISLVRGVQASPPNLDEAQDRCFIKTVALSCAIQALEFYKKYLVDSSRLPELNLHIMSGEVNKLIPGRVIAFKGSLRYEDLSEDNYKRSIVSIQVAPSEIGPGCLPSLPYIAMHEIMCHWPQMMRSPSTRKNPPFDRNRKSLELDPFSEGWMDSIVPDILRAGPLSVGTLQEEVADTAYQIHKDRTMRQRGAYFPGAAWIEPGAIAARLVRHFYAADPAASPKDYEPDFRRLSCELNVAPWSYTERRVGCNLIVIACRAILEGKGILAAHTAIVESLLSFRRTHDLAPFFKALSDFPEPTPT